MYDASEEGMSLVYRPLLPPISKNKFDYHSTLIAINVTDGANSGVGCQVG